MFSYCFINVMEKIQSLELRADRVDQEGCVCCWPEAQLVLSVSLSMPTYIGAPVRSP